MAPGMVGAREQALSSGLISSWGVLSPGAWCFPHLLAAVTVHGGCGGGAGGV